MQRGIEKLQGSRKKMRLIIFLCFTGYSSFPSGHTATAFAAAELLHQDFKNNRLGLVMKVMELQELPVF